MSELDPSSREEQDSYLTNPELPEERDFLGDQPELRTQGDLLPPIKAPLSIFYFIPASYTLGVSVVMGLANASPDLRIGSSAAVGICAVGLLNLLDHKLD